jgi:Ferritin-like domain
VYPPARDAGEAITALQQEIQTMNLRETELRRLEPLKSAADFEPNAVAEMSSALNAVLADLFALYLKTKNFHWHVSGPHFRDYHLLLDEQSAQILAATDAIAERVRKIGERPCIRSVTSPNFNASLITTENLLRPTTCSRNFERTISN